jgi:carboxymethylenebutenolidase
MGKTITLTADDGHRLQAYRADPEGKAKAGLVVIQEIFGVNSHIRQVADDFAKRGYAAVAPAIFDRVERGAEMGYQEPDMVRGRELRAKVGFDSPIKDIGAAAKALAGAGKVGAVGYCWGGSLAWLAACRLDLDCAVGYYGGQTIPYKDEKPRCPVMLIFGDQDASIPLSDVEIIRKAQPKVPIHVFPGAHGFNCDQRASYHKESAAKALEKTLAFFEEHLG